MSRDPLIQLKGGHPGAWEPGQDPLLLALRVMGCQSLFSLEPQTGSEGRDLLPRVQSGCGEHPSRFCSTRLSPMESDFEFDPNMIQAAVWGGLTV